MYEIPFPNTAQKHILEYEQVKAVQEEKEEESVPIIEEHLDETKDEEVTKEEIMAMYAHCNIVELDEETSILLKGKTMVKDLGTKVNFISYDFYLEIKKEITPTTIENTNMTIMLANNFFR